MIETKKDNEIIIRVDLKIDLRIDLIVMELMKKIQYYSTTHIQK